MPGVVAIVVAAGRGVRMGGSIAKQYCRVAGRPVLSFSVDALLRHPRIERVYVVIGEADEAMYRDAVAGLEGSKLMAPVTGGQSRQHSVLHGLKAVGKKEDAIVLVHDAARPFLAQALISRAIEAAEKFGAAVPALAVSDTLKEVGEGGLVKATVDRTLLRSIQTPQAFRLNVLAQSHDAALGAARSDFTDDAAVCEWAGHAVHVFEGDADVFKITTQPDLEKAEWTARRLFPTPRMESRSATGYDVHAFGPGASLWLGGLEIPHERGLVGHSDADPVLHALTDAILGTLGDGDIGAHFPPTDPRWGGASSDIFLRDAVRRISDRAGRIVHLDATIVCEAPKIGPHREAMRTRIAEIAGVSLDRVAVKATTSESLGFTGRREGIAALATATVELPA